MTEKELKKLSRIEILEIMLEQSKEIEQLKGIVAEQEAKISDRAIKVEEAGSIAEASLALNGVMEAAQNAATQYLENIKSLNDNQEEICKRKIEETDSKCAALQMSVQESCENMKAEAAKYCKELKEKIETECKDLKEKVETDCAKLRKDTEEMCTSKEAEAESIYQEKVKKADEEVEAKWADLSTRLEAFYNAHMGLRELLNSNGDVKR